jgi:putative ABC transport system substrate-binding protein
MEVKLCPLMLVLSVVRAPAAVLVAYDSGVEAYSEALDGLRTALGPDQIQTVDLRKAGSQAQLGQALGEEVQAVVAVGSPALEALRTRNRAVPLIVTMVLRPRDTAGISGYLDIELPVNAILAEMRVLLPERRRVGIIRDRARGQPADLLEAAASKEGYAAVIVDCDGPANLLRAVRELKGKVDLLLCLPDATLYNSVTIKPLLLATLEERIPVVGFSPAFVQAGAAAGVYPDYYEVGRQTAEMTLQAIRGQSRTTADQPRRLRAVVNERVARLLGIEFQTKTGSAEVLR